MRLFREGGIGQVQCGPTTQSANQEGWSHFRKSARLRRPSLVCKPNATGSTAPSVKICPRKARASDRPKDRQPLISTLRLLHQFDRIPALPPSQPSRSLARKACPALERGRADHSDSASQDRSRAPIGGIRIGRGRQEMKSGQVPPKELAPTQERHDQLRSSHSRGTREMG